MRQRARQVLAPRSRGRTRSPQHQHPRRRRHQRRVLHVNRGRGKTVHHAPAQRAARTAVQVLHGGGDEEQEKGEAEAVGVEGGPHHRVADAPVGSQEKNHHRENGRQPVPSKQRTCRRVHHQRCHQQEQSTIRTQHIDRRRTRVTRREPVHRVEQRLAEVLSIRIRVPINRAGGKRLAGACNRLAGACNLGARRSPRGRWCRWSSPRAAPPPSRPPRPSESTTRARSETGIRSRRHRESLRMGVLYGTRSGSTYFFLFRVQGTSEAVPVFPGALGHGTTTAAGRGGTVIKVTTLADDVPAPSGSLRAALESHAAVPIEGSPTVTTTVSGSANRSF